MEKTPDTIRLATFNIKHGASADSYKGDPGEVADACKQINADVLALQEVDVGVRRSGKANLATLAAKTVGMEVVFAKTMRFWGGQYGNALLVRGEFEDVEVLGMQGGSHYKVPIGRHKLHLGHEPRNAILATARVKNHRLAVAATHLSTEQSIARNQLAQVSRALARRIVPQAILGDLNLTRKKVIAHLADDSIEFVDYQPTFPAESPRKQIDHIGTKGLEICSAKTIHFAFSDHRALVADVVPKKR